MHSSELCTTFFMIKALLISPTYNFISHCSFSTIYFSHLYLYHSSSPHFSMQSHICVVFGTHSFRCHLLQEVHLLLALRVWASYPVKGRRPAGLRAQGLPAPGPAAWPPGGPRAAAAAPKMPHVLRTFCPGYMWPFGTKLASAQLPPEKVDVNVIFMNLEAISM